MDAPRRRYLRNFPVIVQEGNQKRSSNLNTATEVCKFSLPSFIFLLQNLKALHKETIPNKVNQKIGRSMVHANCPLVAFFLHYVLGRFKNKFCTTKHLLDPYPRLHCKVGESFIYSRGSSKQNERSEYIFL